MANKSIKFDIAKLTGELRLDYDFVTEPPLFADFGTLRAILNNTDIMVNTSFEYDHEGGHVKAIVNDYDLFLEPVLVLFDGYSDIFDRIGQLATFLGNVGIDRINSMSAYIGNDRIQNVANTILEMIPDTINLTLPGYSLYLEGGVNGDIDLNEKYVYAPLDLSLQTYKKYFDYKNPIKFGPIKPESDY